MNPHAISKAVRDKKTFLRWQTIVDSRILSGMQAYPLETSQQVDFRMTRLEIESQIKAIADDVAFTMPFWLAGMLEQECRRQGLTNVKYDGDDFSVTVKIKKPKNPKKA